VSDPLDAVFRPHAVAIVGASHDPTKRGYQAVVALQEAGFAGRIQPVNPRGGEILGLAVARSVTELDPIPELALICTPAATVPGVLEECAARGIRAAVVLALGFGETGEEGAALENELRAVVQRTSIRMVGPNTSGILNLPIGLNLIGARGARAGGIGLLVQSGNMALSLLNQTARSAQEGISICVGAGNQADLGFADYLRYLDGDENTRVIAMYVESLRDGRAFFDAARSPARTKPIVLLKGGRSSAGQTASRSHTGALAGEYAVMRAALAQAGVTEVRRTDELFAVAETLARQPPLRGAIAVLSDGGGHATLAVDALSELKAPLAHLSAETGAALRNLLGPNASVKNPVDLAGASDVAPRVFAQALDHLLDDANVGGVLVVGLFGGYALRFSPTLAREEEETAQQLARSAHKAGKTLVLHSMYAGHASEPLAMLRQAHVPVLESLDVACRCVAAAAEWGSRRNARTAPALRNFTSGLDLLEIARAENRTLLLEPEARALVKRYGVPVVPARFCRNEDEVLASMQELRGGAAVLKVVAPGIVHKSDVGGVRAGIRQTGDAVRAFRGLMALDDDVRGVLLSPQLEPPLAEVLVGARRDPQFGPILMVGMGGTMVEWQRDVAIRLLPIDRADAEAMLSETALHSLLQGIRGKPAGQQDALIEIILGVGDALLANADVLDLECNPVFVDAVGAIAVDARAVLARS
jgi:acetyltransferase